ncbi:MAG: hypothetical protein MUF58_21820 [Arcicella sp.]|nr:hypothetical protein [Arcicella sp.]
MELSVVFTYISFITYVASLSLIIPILVGIIRFKDLQSNMLMSIFVYLCLYAIFEIVAWYYVINGWQNHFLGNTVTYLDILFWSYYYHNLLDSQWFKKIVIAFCIVSTVIVGFSHFAIDKDYNRLNSIGLSIQNLTIISYALLFFFQLINNLNVRYLSLYPHFWIGIAVLIYFSIVFFVEIFAEYITFNRDKEFAHAYWEIKEYLTFFHRIILAIGLWFSKTLLQSNLSSK